MAEGLFRQMVKDRDDIQISSAGVGAIHGQPPSFHAVEVLRVWNIDISKYRSQPLTESLVEKATIIFAMTNAHLETIQMFFPNAAEKTFLLREFESDGGGYPADVPDPIGQGIDVYFQCRDT